jgi:hypothetical protein
MRRAAASALLASLLFAGDAFATTIVMKARKGGGRFEGEIVSRDDKKITLKLKDGKLQTFLVDDIDHLEEPPPPPVVVKETGDAKVDLRTKDYVKRLGFPITASLTELVVVRGDQSIEEMKRIGDAAQKTAEHFCKVFGCRPEEALIGERYGPARVEIFQFLREDAYSAFCDKVLAAIRDKSVDDARLALMKRQRGFWVVTPRSLMAQYQGPSDIFTSISAACHKTSHVLLEGWKQSGDFRPWWLFEGLATWQEFFVLGESRTYCLDLEKAAAYGTNATPGADEEAKALMEAAWKGSVKRMVHKRDEKEFGSLAKLSLNELNFPDVQQSWSLVDWLDRTGRLKEFVSTYKEERDLPAACTKVLNVPVSTAHEQWRAWVLGSY